MQSPYATHFSMAMPNNQPSTYFHPQPLPSTAQHGTYHCQMPAAMSMQPPQQYAQQQAIQFGNGVPTPYYYTQQQPPPSSSSLTCQQFPSSMPPLQGYYSQGPQAFTNNNTHDGHVLMQHTAATMTYFHPIPMGREINTAQTSAVPPSPSALPSWHLPSPMTTDLVAPCYNNTTPSPQLVGSAVNQAPDFAPRSCWQPLVDNVSNTGPIAVTPQAVPHYHRNMHPFSLELAPHGTDASRHGSIVAMQTVRQTPMTPIECATVAESSFRSDGNNTSSNTVTQLLRTEGAPQAQVQRGSGGNVHHGALHGLCEYHSYDEDDAPPPQGASAQGPPGEQLLPLFLQMFPSEHRLDVGVTLQRMIRILCGSAAATVVEVEPRSPTSLIAYLKTCVVWHVIFNLRYRVLMDRHGYWYAATMDQYKAMKDYCERVRTLPQKTRHAKTDGLPCMPLVVELSRTVMRDQVRAPQAPPCFDEVLPITLPAMIRKKSSSNSALPLTES